MTSRRKNMIISFHHLVLLEMLLKLSFMFYSQRERKLLLLLLVERLIVGNIYMVIGNFNVCFWDD